MILFGGKPKDLPADGFVEVGSVDDLPVSSQKSIAYGFERILLCHTVEGIHALADLCPHALQPLLGSDIAGGMIRCAKHGAQFSLATGKPQNGVTHDTLRVYPVRIREGKIQIGVNTPPAAPVAGA